MFFGFLRYIVLAVALLTQRVHGVIPVQLYSNSRGPSFVTFFFADDVGTAEDGFIAGLYPAIGRTLTFGEARQVADSALDDAITVALDNALQDVPVTVAVYRNGPGDLVIGATARAANGPILHAEEIVEIACKHLNVPFDGGKIFAYTSVNGRQTVAACDPQSATANQGNRDCVRRIIRNGISDVSSSVQFGNTAPYRRNEDMVAQSFKA